MLAMAGTAAISWLAQTRQSMRAVRDAERDVIETSEELARLMVLGHDSLAVLQGWTRRGRWSLNVVRVTDALFDISLANRPGARPIVSTTLYRTVSPHAP
jgi:hypothetical protein